MVFIGGGPVSSEYARAVKIERETKEREKRLERKVDGRGTKGQKTVILSRYLFSRLRLDSNVFNFPGTVPTFLLPYPGLVKTPPPPPPMKCGLHLCFRLLRFGRDRAVGGSVLFFAMVHH